MAPAHRGLGHQSWWHDTVIPFSVEYEEEVLEAFNWRGGQEVIAAHQGTKSVLPRIIKCGYKELNLIYFFTAGEKEVRGVEHLQRILGAANGRAPSMRTSNGASSRPSSAPTTTRSTAAAGVHGQFEVAGQVTSQEGRTA